MAPVRSSCHVKQAVNQPVPCTTTFVRHQQVSTVHVCHSKLVCSAHCHASLPHHSAAGFYKAVTVQALTFTDLRTPGTPNMFVAAGPVLQIVCMCQEMRGLRCDSILGFKLLCLTPSKATDTPEDRNNPVLLYNKMELKDMITNFTLEVESQVKIYSLFVRFRFFFFYTILRLSYVLFLDCAFGLVPKVFDWRYFTAKIMDTVNISIPDTEKIINYSPNYYRKLNSVLARYTKRSV